MTKPRFSSLFLRLARDRDARAAFARDPAEFLRSEGIDPGLLDLPDDIDLASLEARIEAAFGNEDTEWTAGEDEIATLGADELWSRFGVIAERNVSRVAVSGVATAIVVYGTSVVTSDGASVAFERARLLRAIARLRKSDLSFTVTRPDGVAIDNLPASAVEALLRRIR